MSKDKRAPISEHLAELIDRLRVIIISVMIATCVVAFIPANPSSLSFDNIVNINVTNPLEGFAGYLNSTIVSMVVRKVKADLLPPNARLIAYSWVDSFSVYFIISFVLGTIVCLPIIAYEIYAYVNPALYPHERRFLLAFSLAFIGLFAFGAWYSYVLLTPITIKFLYYFALATGAEPIFSIRDFFYFVGLIILISGFFFTLPIGLTLAIRYEVIEPSVLEEKRKLVIFAILIVAAIITPDPTPVSMLLISVPFIALYEASIRIGKWLLKSKKKSIS